MSKQPCGVSTIKNEFANNTSRLKDAVFLLILRSLTVFNRDVIESEIERKRRKN